MNWSGISKNPNHPDAIRQRGSALAKALQRPAHDRVQFLCDLAEGKRVLDVGVVEHVTWASDDHNWLHGRITKAARFCLGVDVLEAEIQDLRDKGYNVAVCDITSSSADIDSRFDLVICGELIEHLGNPSGLFETARQLLLPGGRLILTTPNPFYVGRAVRHIFNCSKENVDHVTMLFPSGIAELAARSGLELVAYRGVYLEAYTFKRKLFLPFRWLLCAMLAREAACETFIYECALPSLDPH